MILPEADLDGEFPVCRRAENEAILGIDDIVSGRFRKPGIIKDEPQKCMSIEEKLHGM